MGNALFDVSPYAKWSVMPEERLLVLAEQAAEVREFRGEVAEFGVYYGGSTQLLAAVLPNKTVHAFDSFEGLANLSPEHDRIRAHSACRGHQLGDFEITDPAEIEKISARLASAGVVLHIGPFEAQKEQVASLEFCFAHFDADTYFAARMFLEFFYPRLVQGGRLLVDDFGWAATPGVRAALIGFSSENQLSIWTPGQYQALVIKR